LGLRSKSALSGQHNRKASRTIMVYARSLFIIGV
jgi:hypothetical protein